MKFRIKAPADTIERMAKDLDKEKAKLDIAQKSRRWRWASKIAEPSLKAPLMIIIDYKLKSKNEMIMIVGMTGLGLIVKPSYIEKMIKKRTKSYGKGVTIEAI